MPSAISHTGSEQTEDHNQKRVVKVGIRIAAMADTHIPASTPRELSALSLGTGENDDKKPCSTPLRSTSPSTTTELKADFSITLQSESTATLNATFQRLMEAIHTIPGLSIRGPIRLPKDGKIHSRRVDIKAISERLLRIISEQAGIELSEYTGEESTQESGVIVTFDIE
ncbi:hypothetical protein BGZ70_001968 [Mortierella alpina]|uniref:Uncharacterized protein n=1 Tax=Mortierella alpina TaxID=64518 RepID=A0A9P6JBB5_MORAP|nr:hypothetical protein BGZ70_001968 [Mortierella alpina]